MQHTFKAAILNKLNSPLVIDYIKFNNNLSNVLAAYNGGPNNVDLWRDKFTGLDDDEFVENIPFKETNGYVKRVLRSYYYYKNNY